MNSRVMLGAAFVGLAALAGGMMFADPVSSPNASTEASAAEAQDVEASAPAAAEPAPAPEVPFVIKRILPISGPIKYGEWHWDDADISDGPIVITVDLEARVLSIFKGGYEIGATAVLLGTEEKPLRLVFFRSPRKNAITSRTSMARRCLTCSV